jgi:NitT/TauT family transport system ATP-binding protein
MSAVGQVSEVVFDRVLKIARSKKYHIVVLKDCSFTVPAGQLTVLIGPSGCGKTTIINLIGGYELPDRGKVHMDGKPVEGPNWERLVLFQEMALFPWLTCYQNVMFGPMARANMSRKEANAEAINLLNKVGLGEFKDKYPMQLSGGMQRRAELARALINRPKVMLMDEPFRGLDAMTRELMQEYYQEAMFLADRLLIMTNKPSRVKKVLEVDLPRPRKMEVMGSKHYAELKAEALELLHEEAVKASAASGKADLDLQSGLQKLSQ